jgi:hypothetical protein
MTPNGKPSPEECARAFSRIKDILGDEFTPGYEDHPIEHAYDIAAGFLHDLTHDNPMLREMLTTPEEDTNATA